jgi:hypothetical protein
MLLLTANGGIGHQLQHWLRFWLHNFSDFVCQPKAIDQEPPVFGGFFRPAGSGLPSAMSAVAV